MRKARSMLSEAASIRHEQSQILLSHDNFYVREAYKSLRTNVMFSLTDDRQSHVILVTSSVPGEGKSTTAANLSISLAEAGKKVLLIDCDLRKPRAARLLKIKSTIGLSDTLFSDDPSLPGIVQVKDMELYVLPAGRIPPNPSEILGSVRMQRLLQTLRSRFEYIILDTPPVNVVTDAAAVSPFTDGTLLVVRAGMSERNAVSRAVAQLEQLKVKLLGLVLNGVTQQHSSYGSYRKKYGYDSYSSNDRADN